MNWLCSIILAVFGIVYCVLIRRDNKRHHMETLEAQKEIAETIGTFIADAIKSGMDADK